jgi:sugar lactone lactonase YvrE
MKYFSVCTLLLAFVVSCQEHTRQQSEQSKADSSMTTDTVKNTTNMKATLLLDTKSSLGEGALWNAKTQELYWVDIENGILYIYHPQKQENRAIKLGQKVGTVVPTEDGNVLVALQDGIYEVDLKTEKKKLLTKRPEDSPQNRFNDGKCDPAGRLWVGTMSIEGKEKAGALYLFDNEGKISKKYDSVTVSNGIVWSADSTKMYYIDTPTKEVKEFAYDNKTGQINFTKVAVKISEGAGYPDGMTIDNEGKLWVAMWEGFGVLRFDPDTGELLMKIELPVARVTSCAFGGENLDTLYITTANVGAKEEELTQYPHSGSLFVVQTGHKGVVNFAYKKKKKKMNIGF